MKALIWEHDKITEYWANKLLIPIRSKNPLPQYEGTNYRLWENTWKKHILKSSFPEYCRDPQEDGYLLCNPSNIIHCFQDRNLLEGLTLIIGWGGMVRAKGRIYSKPNHQLEKTLQKCTSLVEDENNVENAWNILVNEFNWGYVITSKCLHFIARSVGFEKKPLVPIDNKVIIEEVWPVFKKMVMQKFVLGLDSMPGGWWNYSSAWEAYNRFMTAINCWASQKGWTTTQLESTLFLEYYPTNKE